MYQTQHRTSYHIQDNFERTDNIRIPPRHISLRPCDNRGEHCIRPRHLRLPSALRPLGQRTNWHCQSHHRTNRLRDRLPVDNPSPFPHFFLDSKTSISVATWVRLGFATYSLGP